MKAVAYLRVSTDEQAVSGLGIAVQLDGCAAWCARERVPLFGPFKDEGVHGDAPMERRPGLLDAMSALDPGDVLLVYKRDRLIRDSVQVVMLESMIVKRSCKLISTMGEGSTGTEDPDDPMAFFQKKIVDLLSHFEVMQVRWRTKGAPRAKRRRGERAGNLPYGYALVDDGKRSRADLPIGLVPDAAEMKTLALIRRLRSEGRSLQQIVNELARRKIPTKTGMDRWAAATIAGLLKSVPIEPGNPSKGKENGRRSEKIEPDPSKE